MGSFRCFQMTTLTSCSSSQGYYMPNRQTAYEMKKDDRLYYSCYGPFFEAIYIYNAVKITSFPRFSVWVFQDIYGWLYSDSNKHDGVVWNLHDRICRYQTTNCVYLDIGDDLLWNRFKYFSIVWLSVWCVLTLLLLCYWLIITLEVIRLFCFFLSPTSSCHISKQLIGIALRKVWKLNW